MINYDYFEYQAKIIRTKFVSDKRYLTKRFISKLGYTPSFCSPRSFNEKVTARMIFERSPLHTKLADKFAVRELIIDKISDTYLVPLLGVYKNFNDIDFNQIQLSILIGIKRRLNVDNFTNQVIRIKGC